MTGPLVPSSEPPGLWAEAPAPGCHDGRPAHERLEILRRTPVFDYPAAAAIRSTVRRAVAGARPPLRPPGRYLIVGPGDNGRSLLAHQLAAGFEADGLGTAWIMMMPASAASFAAEVVAAARPLRRPVGRTAALRDIEAKRAMREAAERGLRLLVLDGADILRDPPARRRRVLLHALHAAGQDAGVTIVIVGAPPLAAVLAGDRDRVGRWEPLLLPRWRLDQDWVDLLARWDAAMPLRHRSGLATRELGTRLYALSDGRLGALSRILQAAAVAAIEAGDERISIDLLDRLGFHIAASFSGFGF